MAPRYEIGQKVTIMPAKNQRLSPRDSDLEPYAGRTGKVADYYWISRGAEAFYLYIVMVGDGQKKVVLHEDELQAYIE